MARPGPWGHSATAHQRLGFCADCPGHTFADEAAAWRVWSTGMDGAYVDRRAAWRRLCTAVCDAVSDTIDSVRARMR